MSRSWSASLRLPVGLLLRRRDCRDTRGFAGWCLCVVSAKHTQQRIAGTSLCSSPALLPESSFTGHRYSGDLSGTFHGHDGYLHVWRGVLQSFEDVRLDPEELLDFGDCFVVTIKVSADGTGSGVSTSQSQFQVFTLRRGLVIRQHDLQDRAEALEAVTRRSVRT